MAFREFTGELDAPSAPQPTGKFREFTGELDPQPMTAREAFESHPVTRLVRGIEGPAITLMKMVGPDSIKQQLGEIDQLREAGMKKRGNEGFDWAGLVGSLVPGGAIAKGVTGALPAATSVLGKMGVGAATGAATAGAQPLPGNNELSADKLKQMGTGAVVGGTIPALIQGVKSFFGTSQLNPTQASTLKEGQAAGYTVPPSMQNPSGLNNTLESLAGKDAVKQAASAKNQLTTNVLAARALGLPTDQPITPGALKAMRTAADQVYDKVDNLSPTAKTALRELRGARYKADLHFNHFFASKNPDALDQAEYQKGLAQLFQQEIENEAKAAGRPDLVQALADARKKIAKTYDVERALTEADSNVSAPSLARLFDEKGSKAVTGELATIGKMGGAFKPVMREGATVPVAGVSGTDALTSALLGGIGLGASGPLGASAAALPWIMRPAARNLVLSPLYQRTIAQGIPARYIPVIDALTQQATGAGGATAGRAY